MTAANHAITGALIAAVVPVPIIGLPLALLSHFVLDALPHYGDAANSYWGTKKHHTILVVDTLVSVLVALAIVALFAKSWPLMLAGAVLAIIPDIVWLPYYLDTDKKGTHKPFGPIARLHKAIQWGERPWGLIIEILWFILMLSVFYVLLIK